MSAAEANAVAASRTIRLDQPIQNVVSGSNRHKYFKRPIIPFMSAQPPEVLFATTRDGESALDAPAAEPEPLARDAGCQSDMRESDTQTDPYTPDYVVPAGTEPEVLGLAALKWGQGLPAGLHEVQMIERARAKRAFEAALPPMTDEASLALRRKMMSEQELRDWNVREGEIFANLVRGARPPIAPPASAAGDPSALPFPPPPLPPCPPPPSVPPRHARLPVAPLAGREGGGVRRGAARAVGGAGALLGRAHRAHASAQAHREGPRDFADPAAADQGAAQAVGGAEEGGGRPPAARRGDGVRRLRLGGVRADDAQRQHHPRQAGARARASPRAPPPHPSPPPPSAPPHRPPPSRPPHQAHRYETKPLQLETLHGLQELESGLPKKLLLSRVTRPGKAAAKGYAERKASRMAAQLDRTDASLKAAKQARPSEKDQREALLAGYRDTKPIERSPTPTVAPPEQDEEVEVACVLLQRLLRGRAIQNMVYAGKERRLELIRELQAAPDEAAAADDDDDAAESAAAKAVEGAQALLVGVELDRLAKELRRCREERRIADMVRAAEELRRVREAEESGRRQAEMQARAEHEERFRQLTLVHNASAASYIAAIVDGAVDAAAAKRAAAEAALKAGRLNGIVDSLEEKLAHPTATVHELVDGFVLPEVERQIARREELAEDGKYASAAGKELEKVVAAVELATGGY